MNEFKLLPFIVGIAAVTLYFIGYLQKTRKRIIALNATSRLLYIIQYILLSAFEGAVLDVAGIISSLLAQKKDKPFIKKHIRLFFIGVNLFVIAMGCITYESPISILPIVAVLFHTGAFWIDNERWIRRLSLIGSPLWLIYNFVCGAYGSCIGDILSIVSLLISIARYDIRKNKV